MSKKRADTPQQQQQQQQNRSQNHRKPSTTPTTAGKFVISRPISSILRDPLQLKLLVPRSGRSSEHQIRQQDSAIRLSIQSQRSSDCPILGHAHFDLVARLRGNLRAAHLLCRVMYRNVRHEVKDMGPYLLQMTDPVCCFRLEEMNCQVSPKTNHYHVYLALQLVSVETGEDNREDQEAGTIVSGDNSPDELSAQRPPRSRHESSSSYASVSMDEPQQTGLQPTGAQLPDFSVPWSPLATLKLSSETVETDGPLYCTPHLLCLCSETFRELLPAVPSASGPGGGGGQLGELVLPGASHSDLLLLLQLTYPGTPCTVNLANVRQVLRIAHKFCVPHLTRTAELLLSRSLHCGRPLGTELRTEVKELAGRYSLSCLSELLKLL